MKILLLIDGLRAGGKERRLIELIKGLTPYPDIKLYLVVFSEQVHFKEIFEYDIPITILKRVPKKNPMVLYRLYKICKNWRPNLIHSWGTMSTILAIPAASLLRVPIINGNIANAPNNFTFFDKRLVLAKFTFPFSKVVASNSLAGLKVYGVPKNKGICIYNGFDTHRTKDLVSAKLIREQFNIKTNKIIGMVGGFYGKKDYKTFIEAAIVLMKKRQDVSFIAVGGGPELDDHKKMIPSKYAARFVFTDIQKDVESIVNIIDIGVLSTYTEGISNAILEYMALSKPVIVTIGGGTVETVEDSITGFLIPPFSPEMMAEKMSFLLENEKIATQMGTMGRKRLESVFSLEQMTTSFYQVYKKTLKP